MPITHEFCDGLYSRTMFVPKDTVLTGAIHRSENFFFLRTGEMTLWTDDGMKRALAGAMFKSSVGTKRVGFAHLDCLITTVHFNPMNETDPETLWELFTIEDSAYVSNEHLIAIGVAS